MVFLMIVLACSKGRPKVTGLVDSNGISPVSLKSSLATNAQGENQVRIVGICDSYPGRDEIRTLGGSWVNIDKVASGDTDCSDGSFQVSLSPEKLGITSRGRTELQIRQVFRFGYSSVQSLSIWVLDESPSLSLKYSTWYVNLASDREYFEVKGTCNLEEGHIALSAAILGATLALGTAICKDKSFSKSISTDLFGIAATWSLNATYLDASSYFATSTLISDTWAMTGLTHKAIQNSVLIVEGNELSNLKFEAIYPDPSIKIVYSIDTSLSTCVGLGWESSLAVTEEGALTGRPSLSAGGQICSIYYRAKARSEEISGLYYTVSILESYCDSGSWDTRCEISRSKTIPNNFVFTGESFSLSSELFVNRDSLTNTFGKFFISANQGVNLLSPSVIHSSLEINAKSFSIEGGSMIDATGYGYFGWQASESAAHSTRHGPCSGSLASGGGFGGLGGVVSIATYLNLGQVNALGGDTAKIPASGGVYSGAGAGGKIKFNPTLLTPNPANHSVSGGLSGTAGTSNGSSGGTIN